MTYHERLKQSRPTAAQLEEQKRRMSQGPTLLEIEARLGEAEQAQIDQAEFGGYAPGEIPVNDGTPPAPPSNVIVSPFFHQLDVAWDEPPLEDWVARAFVRVRPAELSDPESETTLEATIFGGYVADLPAEPHTVEASFEDRWGNRSVWSEAVTGTPLLTAAESIDFTAAEIAGSLGWENLDALDENSDLTLAERQAKLGDYIITARAMAAQNLAATRLWAQTGAFESAMINNLAVDKLMAGTFTAGEIILAGSGSLRAGKTRFSVNGIVLPVGDAFDAPSSRIDEKITNTGGWGSIQFYADSAGVGPVWGMGLRADGNPGTSRKGVMTFIATESGNLAANSSVQIQMISNPGSKGYVNVLGTLYVRDASAWSDSVFVRRQGTDTYGELEYRSNGKLYFGGREVSIL